MILLDSFWDNDDELLLDLPATYTSLKNARNKKRKINEIF